jgi:hypothetical protein
MRLTGKWRWKRCANCFTTHNDVLCYILDNTTTHFTYFTKHFTTQITTHYIHRLQHTLLTDTTYTDSSILYLQTLHTQIPAYFTYRHYIHRLQHTLLTDTTYTDYNTLYLQTLHTQIPAYFTYRHYIHRFQHTLLTDTTYTDYCECG